MFTGWADVPLTAGGEQEAVRAGELLRSAGERPDTLHTSVLRRAMRTAEIVLDELDRDWLPVNRTWRLNERQYGALAGRRKSRVRAEAGDEQYRRWRRSLYEVPPPSSEAQMAELAADPRYAALGSGALPAAESLADVQARILPYWVDVLSAELRAGLVPLVVAHGNSLRALVAYLDRLDEEQVARLDIPTGIPLRYEFDDDWEQPAGSGAYLDPEAAALAAAAVARE